MLDKIKHAISFEQGMTLTLNLCEAYESLPNTSRELDIEPLKCTAVDLELILKAWPQNFLADDCRFMPLDFFYLNNPQEMHFSYQVYRIGLIVSRIFGSIFRTPKKFYFPKKAIERKQYIQSIQKMLKIVVGRKMPTVFFTRTLGAVVLGAKDKQFQLDNKLNKEKIDFLNLLYYMTGAEEKRSQLKLIIKKIRHIRYKMILRYRRVMARKKLSLLEQEYHANFEALLIKREHIATHEKKEVLINAIDDYLFKMIDSTPLNRPSLEDVKDYDKSLKIRYKPEKIKQTVQTIKLSNEEISCKISCPKMPQKQVGIF